MKKIVSVAILILLVTQCISSLVISVKAESQVTIMPTRLPQGIQIAASIWEGTNAYIFGGASHTAGPFNSILKYNPITGSISSMSAVLPDPVCDFPAVWTGQYVYTFGGYVAHLHTSDKIVRYDPSTDTIAVMGARLPNYAFPLYSMCAIWDGNYAYLFGGYDGYSYYDQILRYDPVNDQITVMNARLPTGTKWMPAVWSGTYAYVFGGRTPYGASDQIVRYDPTHDSTTVMSAKLPIGILVSSAVWAGSCAYVFGGSDINNQMYDSILKYDPASDSIATVDNLPTPRRFTCAVWDGSSAYIFGGEDSNSQDLDEIVEFSPVSGSLFEDDFENYVVGTFPSSGGWELVYDGAGSQYQIVTDAYCNSPIRSLQLLGTNGWSANVQRKFTSDSSLLGYEAYMLAQSKTGSADHVGQIAFWNLQGAPWGKRLAVVQFDEDGNLYTAPVHLGPVYVNMGPYEANRWYHVKVLIDRDAGKYSVWIDDSLKAADIAIPDTYEINALELESGHAGVKVFFDDVGVFERESARRFSPIVDGFSFRNIIPVGKVSYWDALSALSSSTWAQSIPIWDLPLLAWFSVEVQNSLNFGNCFGMSYTAKYYYENPSLFETKYPGYANMHAVKMDVASPEILVNQFPGLEVIPPYFFNLIMTCLGIKSTNEEMQWLMTQCDNYRVVPLSLVGTFSGTNSPLVHCVLVYNYACSPDGNRLDLSIYDPNDMLFPDSSSFSGSTYHLTLEKDTQGNFIVAPTGSTNDLTNWYSLDQIGCGEYTSIDWSKIASYVDDLLRLIWGYLKDTNGNLLGIRLDCPVNVMVTDPTGKRIGYDSSTLLEINEIVGAFHSGSGTEPQIIVIPDPSDGLYSITLTGTGTGNYTLTIEYVNATQTATQIFNGTIAPQETRDYSDIISSTGQTPISWHFVFKDTKRGTMLKISTDDKYFQFIAPNKDFGIKHDPNMISYRNVIAICYKDSEILMTAIAATGKIVGCTATLLDRQTRKLYWLFTIQKPLFC